MHSGGTDCLGLEIRTEVVYWQGGLLHHEIEVIQAMHNAFKDSDSVDVQASSPSNAGLGGMAWLGKKTINRDKINHE